MNQRLEKRIVAARINEMKSQIDYLRSLMDALVPVVESIHANIWSLESRIEAEKASVNNPVDTQSESK